MFRFFYGISLGYINYCIYDELGNIIYVIKKWKEKKRMD